MTNPDPNRANRRPAVAGGRLGRIVRGYLGACFVAAWALPLGLIFSDLVAGHQIGDHLKDFGVVVGGLFIVVLIAAAPLATAAIVATETYRVRSLAPFLGSGAVIGLIIQGVASIIVEAPHGLAHWLIFALVALVGAIAGAIYWAIAVRGYRPSQMRD